MNDYRQLGQSHVAAKRQAKLERIAVLSRTFQDTMQVCLDGHKITGHYERNPEQRRSRCAACGEPTITSCQNCGTSIKGYMQYAGVISPDDSEVPAFCDGCGEPYPWNKLEEKKFLAADFGSADVSHLNIQSDLKSIIQSRLDDAGRCLGVGVAMPVVFLCGSAVEGMLLAYASNNPKLYNTSVSTPKADGKIKPLSRWSLEELINVATEVKHINTDAKKFTHPLKEFRNYIHPREQLNASFNPDIETAKVCYQVTKLVISNLEKVH